MCGCLEELPLTIGANRCARFTWRRVVVWQKTEGVRLQLARFRNQQSTWSGGSKGPMPLGRHTPVLPGIIREPGRKADKHHITGKSPNLMRPLVRIFPELRRILEPFAVLAARRRRLSLRLWAMAELAVR